ncbi:hydrogenase [Sphaerotilus sp.]|uniref:hydrogenase n=1 Tax=Sphaerotilus sp. TaxID=2093942 RepID=UPI002ACD443F|nr:hydrogenase [Sphaerotilus sp.]MDZ7858320.1 hydrogenase [Sphaerotilus sp.]
MNTNTPDLHPLMARLVRDFGARVVTPDSVEAWAAEGGDRVLLLGGDPVRFPEALDAAVVLPELQRAHAGRFQIALGAREDEEGLARRYGSRHWPALVFLRDGRYVTAVSGMHDWTDYVARVGEALAMAPSRVPGVGIPVVSASASTSTCH